MKLDDAFSIHEQALLLRTRRAEVLAANIANADTPGYQARDFDFRAVLRREIPQGDRMRTTSARHIQPDTGPVSATELYYRIPTQPSVDGNTVDTQLEHTAYAANAMEYQASLRFLGGDIKKLMLAIKGQ